MERTDIQLAHEIDAAWIIALYIAVHGGDPAPALSPAAAAVKIITAVASAIVPEQAAGLTVGALEKNVGALEKKLNDLNIKVHEINSMPGAGSSGAANVAEATFRPRTFNVTLPGGLVITVDIPLPPLGKTKT
jgi:hypothetical protein